MKTITAAIVVCLCASGAATANEGDDGTVRQLIAEGNTAYERRDFEACVGKFQRAYSLRQVPQIKLNLGVCYQELGRFRDAASSFYSAIKSGKLTPAEQAQAVELLDAVRARLGFVEIRAQGTDKQVLIDNTIRCALPCVTELDPGDHIVRVPGDAGGRSRRFRIQPGEREVVLIAASRQSREQGLTLTTQHTATDGEQRRLGWLSVVGASTAGTGIAGIIGFGIRTQSIKGDFNEMPTSDLASKGKRARALTNVSIGIAVVGLGLAVVDWLRR